MAKEQVMEPMKLFGWDSNPFTFQILPEIYVGYEGERQAIISGLSSGEKFFLILGPTGSGKTTFLKNLVLHLDSYAVYIPKPPKKAEDWMIVLDRMLRPGLFSFLSKRPRNLYEATERLGDKFSKKRVYLLVDEAHEASTDSLEWLRVIADQTPGLSIVLAGLPVFERTLKENLETFMKRLTTTIKLTNLTKSETRELIKRRIEAIGGEDIKPFSSEVVDIIYNRTAGFPREVLRVCNEYIQGAVRKNVATIDLHFVHESVEEPRIPLETVDGLPERQKAVLEILSLKGPLTPSEIINELNIEEYKSKGNALRSVNNLLGRLMREKLVERKRKGKSYRYSVSARYQTIMVKA
jgi:type II secretory pathway predicted ATPase ExeA